MSKSCSGKINKTGYDDPGKPMKPTGFTVKKLGENFLKSNPLQKREVSDLVQNPCPQTLKSLQMNLQQKPSTASEPLNSSIYERHPFCTDPST